MVAIKWGEKCYSFGLEDQADSTLVLGWNKAELNYVLT